MKKTFVNPEMNISLFEMENVLTVSGKGNLTNAQKAVGVADLEKDITAIDFNNIVF